jgi:hypothetical protein
MRRSCHPQVACVMERETIGQLKWKLTAGRWALRCVPYSM